MGALEKYNPLPSDALTTLTTVGSVNSVSDEIGVAQVPTSNPALTWATASRTTSLSIRGSSPWMFTTIS